MEIVLEVSIRIVQGGLMAWLWRKGGKIDKDYRRVIAPVLVFIITRNIGVALMIAGLGRVPTTLVKDDLKVWGQIFWWTPFLCALHAVPVFVVAGLWPTIGLFVLQYLMILGSNLIDFPKWNWYEKVYGFVLGVVLK